MIFITQTNYDNILSRIKFLMSQKILSKRDKYELNLIVPAIERYEKKVFKIENHKLTFKTIRKYCKK